MASISQALALAVQHHQAGRLQAAEQVYRQIVAVEPNNPDAWHLLGVIAGQLGKLEVAVEHIGRAIGLKKTDAVFHNNLGYVLKSQGKLDEAVACYRRARELKPDYVEAHGNLGNVLQQQGKLDEAIACYHQALDLKPDHAEARNNLGDALYSQGKVDEAIACYRRALESRPGFAEAHYNLGNALRDQGRLDEAIASYHRALELKPDCAEAHNNLGLILDRLNLLQDAERSYREAHRLRPDSANASMNLGALLAEQGRRDEAIACYERAIRADPHAAEAHWGLAKLLLLEGRYLRAWPEFEWRLEHPRLRLKRDLRQPRWDASPGAGRTILLHTEGGFGDALHFGRYVPLVARRGEHVILECQPELARLFRGLAGPDRVLVRGEPLPPFDVQAPLQSLPLAFGTVLETVPNAIPYLSPNSEQVQAWRIRLRQAGGRFKVGLVWSGSVKKMGRNDPNCGLACFGPLAELPGLACYSLQKGPAADELRQPPPGLQVIDLAPHLTDFAETAAALANLDLLISVDTSVVHLAGALGRPVWAALGFLNDFRWLVNREDTPWYPTMRLFRQTKADDWRPVFQRIKQELGQVLENRPG